MTDNYIKKASEYTVGDPVTYIPHHAHREAEAQRQETQKEHLPTPAPIPKPTPQPGRDPMEDLENFEWETFKTHVIAAFSAIKEAKLALTHEVNINKANRFSAFVNSAWKEVNS